MKCRVLGMPQIGKGPGDPSRHSTTAGGGCFPTNGLISSSSSSCMSQLLRRVVLEPARQTCAPSWVFPSRAGEHHHVHVFPPSLKAAATGASVWTSLRCCAGTCSSLVPKRSWALAQQEWGQPWAQVRDREEQVESLYLVVYSYFKSKNKFDKTTATFP